MNDEHCAECGKPLTPEDAYARESDEGAVPAYEFVCGECRWA